MAILTHPGHPSVKAVAIDWTEMHNDHGSIRTPVDPGSFASLIACRYLSHTCAREQVLSQANRALYCGATAAILASHRQALPAFSVPKSHLPLQNSSESGPSPLCLRRSLASSPQAPCIIAEAILAIRLLDICRSLSFFSSQHVKPLSNTSPAVRSQETLQTCMVINAAPNCSSSPPFSRISTCTSPSDKPSRHSSHQPSPNKPPTSAMRPSRKRSPRPVLAASGILSLAATLMSRS